MASLNSRRHLLLSTALAASLWLAHTAVSQGVLQVGYAVISASGPSTLPAASALFSFFNSDGILISEAGIEAVAPISRGRIFVESGATRTGMALANPSDGPVTADLVLRDQAGMELDRQELHLAAGGHDSAFVDELFATAPADLAGSLTFETGAPEQRLAAVTVRQSANANGEPLFATLPVAGLEDPAAGPQQAPADSIVLPHLGAGGAGSVVLSTQIVLINPLADAVEGEIRLFGAQGEPLEADLDGEPGSSFDYRLEGHGVFRRTLTSSASTVTGYALVTVEQGSAAPAGTAVFQFRDASGRLASEAGVAAVEATTAARILVDTAGTRTGVALASPGGPARVTFSLLDRNGTVLETVQRDVADGGHLPIFADELFDSLETGFLGQMEIRSDLPVVPVTLKLTVNARGDLILTTLPLADLQRPAGAQQLVIPQLGYGAGGGLRLSTRLIFINFSPGTPTLGSLLFRRSDGGELVPPGEASNRIEYQIGASSLAQLEEGAVTLSKVEILNLADPAQQEIVVNAGDQLVLDATGLDTFGRVQGGVALAFSNLDAQVAEVSAQGVIEGLEAGFSTLRIGDGDVERELTITVQEISSSPAAAFSDVRGVQQDLAGRVYLAVGGSHTIVRFDSLDQAPVRYAGTEGTAGLQDEARLNAQFRAPAFLSLDQNDGRLFVSDSLNHVIRVAHPGEPDPASPQSPRGRVETFAGTGTPGSLDGAKEAASFNNPQGLARFGGFLWVADSGNHTIRRINVLTGMVETVAGQAGSPGQQDGQGAQARFNAPTGLAAERREGSIGLIVADTGNGVLRRVFEDGMVETVGAGDGPGSQSVALGRLGKAQVTFDEPTGVAVDPFGNIFVSEPETGRVKALLTSGDTVEAAQAETFLNPRGLAITQAGRLIVAEEDGTAGEIFYGTPEIFETDPDQTSSQGGAEVTIKGRNFAPDSLVVIRGAVFPDARVVDTATIRFTTSPLPSGVTTLTVQHRGGLAQTPLLIQPLALADLPVGSITTVAGGSTFSGDGGTAMAARLNVPGGVALDGAGNLFIADSVNDRVRRVEAGTGLITTVAGNGDFGFSGDGGPATAARLGCPRGVALDGAGNLFIADSYNDRVRRVEAGTGLITTVAGNGDFGFSGDGGPAAAAALAEPTGVALDAAGNLFIADSVNHRIRRVEAATGLISTVAGNGLEGFSGDGGPAAAARLNFPQGVVLDSAGNLFIADRVNSRIRRVEAATGLISTVAGNGGHGFSGDGGAATATALTEPAGVALDGAGNLFIADQGNHRIRRVEAATGLISTVAGNGMEGFSGDGGPAAAASLAKPHGVVLDGAGSLIIADTYNRRVRKVEAATGLISTVAGNGLEDFSGDGGPAAAASLAFPNGMVLDGAGNLFIADTFNHRVRKVEAATGLISTVAGNGEEGFSGDGGAALDAALNFPSGITLDGAGNLFIAHSNRVRRVEAATGLISTVAGNGLPGFSGDGVPATATGLIPSGVAVDGAGNLFIADLHNYRVRRVDAATGLISTYAGTGCTECPLGDGGPATAASLFPHGVALDGAGNLYIADAAHFRVRRVDAATGLISTVAGNGDFGFSGDGGAALDAALSLPSNISLDGAGNLFISDLIGNRIRRVDAATGLISTVAGNGQKGFLGDGGPATATGLSCPRGVALDGAGNLFIATRVDPIGRIRAVRGPLP